MNRLNIVRICINARKKHGGGIRRACGRSEKGCDLITAEMIKANGDPGIDFYHH